jgi:hypothetical protein
MAYSPSGNRALTSLYLTGACFSAAYIYLFYSFLSSEVLSGTNMDIVGLMLGFLFWLSFFISSRGSIYGYYIYFLDSMLSGLSETVWDVCIWLGYFSVGRLLEVGGIAILNSSLILMQF